MTSERREPELTVFAAGQVVGGRFRVVKMLGQGGMGEVYEAFDLQLRDYVALKTIRQEIASDDRSVERFKQEVQRSRAISHPNVCRVHDLFRGRGPGDADVWFLTMELLRGETLSDRLRRNRRLDTDAAFPVVKQMCDALDAAHKSGVVHRDFKSGNIMLVADPKDSAVRVVVTDFGLARPITASGAGLNEVGGALSASQVNTYSLDDPGSAAGTPAYISPEQLEGKAATAASDLYSLGVVMYEMVTGTRPFVGDSALSVAVQRLTQAPATPRTHVPDLDPRWEQTILRCLERDPARRFTSAGHVSRALDETHPVERGTEQPQRRYGQLLSMAAGLALALVLLFNTFSGPALAVSSIAVVPFRSEGLDRETEYLTDGVTEGIIDSLSQLPQPTLKVIALTSIMRYKDHEIDAKAIGRELKVGAVVIGKVVQRSDRLTISAELVNATDQSRMWGKTYTAGLLELPKLQQDIAEGISEHLRFPSAGDRKTMRLTKRYPDNVDAYRLYLKGRYFWNRYTEEGWKKAIGYFNQAIEIDPNYAPAWAGLADTYYQMSSIVLLPVEAIPRARAAAIRALAIDDGVAEAHASLGIIKAQYDWDPKGAEKEFKRALELNSNYATAHQWYGMFLYADTQFEAAQVELDRAHELDPFSMIVAVTAVWPLRHLGQDDVALKQLDKIIEMFPNFPDLVDYAHEIRGEQYLQKGMHDEAVAELLHGYRMKEICGDDPDAIDAVKRAYAEAGLNGYWQKQVEVATRRYERELETARTQSPQRYVSPYRLAELNARIGEKERALALLQESYKNRDERVRWLKAESLAANSPWESIRPDPRFSAILRGVGLGG